MEERYVVGVRFKPAGKKYYFDPGNFDLSMNDMVIVDTVRGLEMGEVIEEKKLVSEQELIASLKSVMRKATNKDLKQHERNLSDRPEVLKKCQTYVTKNKLDMKLLGSEYTLDRMKLIIYFNAEGRIDFRELVKDLANEFKVRIELRQVGARDGAKFLGGIGPCGLLLCCNTFLGEFDTVSIKMAKNQNLSLNPVNISGLCGKLLCCIKYEEDTYKELRVGMPKVGVRVKTEDGNGVVNSINILNRTAKVSVMGESPKEYPANELEILPKKKG